MLGDDLFSCQLLGSCLLNGQFFGCGLFRCGLFGREFLRSCLFCRSMLGREFLRSYLVCCGLLGRQLLRSRPFRCSLLGSQLLRSYPFRCGLFGSEFLGGGLLCRSLLGSCSSRTGLRGFKGTQSSHQFGSHLGVMCVVRMNFLRLLSFGRCCSGGFIHLRAGGLEQAGVQRSRHVRFIRMVGRDRRFSLVGVRLEYDVRHLRLGVAVAHGDDLGGERIHVGQLRLGSIELTHHVIDHVDRLAKQTHAVGRQRQVGCAQTLEQAFQWRQQLRQQRNIDHRDRTMQGVHGAQQFFTDRQFVLAALDGSADGLQILRHFTAQDFQQDRIHRRHHRHRDDVVGLNRRLSGSSSLRVGHAGFRNTLGGSIDSRHAVPHDATDRFHGCWCVIFQAYLVAGSQLFGGMHDRTERCVRRTVALERRQQLRQRIDRVSHQCLHVLVRLDRVVEHAVEHVLHFPRELAQHAGTDQSPRTLQRVERAADADQ